VKRYLSDGLSKMAVHLAANEVDSDTGGSAPSARITPISGAATAPGTTNNAGVSNGN